MKRLCLLLLFAAAACVKPPVVTAPDAGVAATTRPDAGNKYALDADKLQRFKSYRTKLRAAYADASAEQKRRLEAMKPPDGGQVDGLAYALESANRRTQARATCATEVGLNPSDALIIEAMVFNVMAQRSVAKNGEYAKLLAQVKAGLDNMHPDQKVDAIKDMEELEAMLKKMETAEALKDTLGAANVELILAHAEELMPLYEQALTDERSP